MALLHVNFSSSVLGLKCSMDVILPERPCPYADKKWPTLYLLHGLSDDHTVWQRRTSIERYVDGMDLAVVMPSVHRSFYTDMRHGMRFWTFISEELPTLCERMFPLSPLRENRFAAGLSMGGYGAFKLGLLKPDRYAAVASLSGAVDMVAVAGRGGHDEADEEMFTDIFGDLDEMIGGDDDLTAAAQRLIDSGAEKPRFYMACGTEDFLYDTNVDFFKAYGSSLGIRYEEGPGAHTWAFWDTYIQHVLKWLPLA